MMGVLDRGHAQPPATQLAQQLLDQRGLAGTRMATKENTGGLMGEM